MRISELAERSGLSTGMIRFYERSGALPGPRRRDNGYRDYSAADLDRATTFATFRNLGLAADVASRLAEQCATGQCDMTSEQLPPLLAAQRDGIRERVAGLLALDAQLAALQDVLTAGQPRPPKPENGKETLVVHCDCDGGCCGPCC
jgi:DNA-binding transcriptional MerR regulator